MGDCARRLAVDALEQMIMPGASTSSSDTALEDCLPSSSRHDVALVDRSGARCSMESKSDYFSPRVEEMMRSKSQFSSDVEHEIEHSRVHWSEVPSLSKLLEDDGLDDEDEETCLSKLSEENEHEEEEEEVTRENREVFGELVNDPQWEHHERGHFFREWSSNHWKLGGKIAEGGQAAIFEVLDTHGNVDNRFLLKVFKRGSRLLDLKKQWPHGILRQEIETSIAWEGCILEDGRFAFWMARCWGDLRKLIDQAMQEKNNQGPPFPYQWYGISILAKKIMRQIAMHMVYLHERGILHRDLKAANILLLKDDNDLLIYVADFECSIGVVGTGFWRAPEILSALKHRNPIDFTEKMDVYSFGMTCFEIVTGCLPFEGELKPCRDSYDLVIGGRRPKLPSDLDVPMKDLIERCWNPTPTERPNFAEIRYALNHLD